MLFNNHPHLYQASLVDLSDVAEAVGKEQSGFYKLATGNCSSGGKYFSMPMAIIGALNVYRKSWFAEVGYNEFPKTWDQYRDAGKKLKAKGLPDRSIARPVVWRPADVRLSIPVVARRDRSRRQGQGSDQHTRRGRGGQVHGRLLEGLDG